MKPTGSFVGMDVHKATIFRQRCKRRPEWACAVHRGDSEHRKLCTRWRSSSRGMVNSTSAVKLAVVIMVFTAR